MTRYSGQCFCHPELPNGECVHCNRARAWVDQDLLALANELGGEIDVDSIENYDPLQEVNQWWIVTERIHRQLRDVGEMVAEWKGQYWWARMCGGQGIEMDGTLQAISRKLGE